MEIAWAEDSLTVVCDDDGAVYWTTSVGQEWKEGTPIPGSQADLARNRSERPVVAVAEPGGRRFARDDEEL